jgi:hypothetical protein
MQNLRCTPLAALNTVRAVHWSFIAVIYLLLLWVVASTPPPHVARVWFGSHAARCAGIVHPGTPDAALGHFLEQILQQLLCDLSSIELLEPAADTLLALILAQEALFTQLVGSTPVYS